MEKELSSDFWGSICKSVSSFTYRNAFFVLLLLLCIMTLTNTMFIPLECGDETRVAGISAEVALQNDYFLPQLNGNNFLEYPPLYYIVQSVMFDVFGFNDFAAKLPSILCGIAGALMIFGCAKSFGARPFTSLIAGLFLGGCIQYYGNSLTSMVDSMLAMFCILAWWGFSMLCITHKNRFSGALMLACGIAGGLLTKNLPGLAVPVSGMGIYLILSDIQLKKFSFTRYLYSGIAILAGLGCYGVYAFFLYSKHGYEAFHELVIWNNIGRFSGTSAQHVEPFYYYLQKLPEQLHPYLVLMPFAIYYHVREAWRSKSQTSLYLLCILFVPYVLLTISSGKRQVYLLPLAAPSALMAITMLEAFFTHKFIIFKEKYIPAATRIFIGLFALAMIVCPIVFTAMGVARELNGVLRYWPLPILVILGGYIIFVIIRNVSSRMTIPFAMLAFAFLYPMLAGTLIASRSEQRANVEELYYDAERLADGRDIIVDDSMERLMGAAFYYLGRNIPEFDADDFVLSPNSLYIVSQGNLKRLRFAELGWQINKYSKRYYLVLPPE